MNSQRKGVFIFRNLFTQFLLLYSCSPFLTHYPLLLVVHSCTYRIWQAGSWLLFFSSIIHYFRLFIRAFVATFFNPLSITFGFAFVATFFSSIIHYFRLFIRAFVATFFSSIIHYFRLLIRHSWLLFLTHYPLPLTVYSQLLFLNPLSFTFDYLFVATFFNPLSFTFDCLFVATFFNPLFITFGCASVASLFLYPEYGQKKLPRIQYICLNICLTL